MGVAVKNHLPENNRLVWVTKDGTEMAFSEMTDSHVMNAIKFIERNYRNEVALMIMGGDANEYYTKHSRVEEVPGYTQLLAEKYRRHL